VSGDVRAVKLGDGAFVHVAERGEGETVVFSHSFLVDHRQWQPQLEALSPSYRCVAYDHRGHGGSTKTTTSYDLDRLVDDGVAVIEAFGPGPVHWVGLSTGGFVGMRLALRRPDLLRSLVLADTAANAEPTLNKAKYEAMFKAMELIGPRPPLVNAIMKIMFGESFMSDPARAHERAIWRERFANQTRNLPALRAFSQAIFDRDDVLERLSEVTKPTLLMVGAEDTATPVVCARRMAERIPDAELVIVPDAGHLSSIANAGVFTATLQDWLRAQSG
jgi:pimeloyl-ACP methyl ester carboxylesterase